MTTTIRRLTAVLGKRGRRLMLPLMVTSLLVACGPRDDLTKPPEPVGNFQLGYTIVVAKNMKKVGPSREATPEEWQEAIKQEVIKRTGRYDGDKLYHIGISVDGYALAYPGIPVVLNPKSVLVISANVWDDTAQRRINAKPKQITVFEPFSGETLIGSGLTQSRETQMKNLSAAAAVRVNEWLVENKAWFTPEAVAARKMLPPMTGGAAGSAAQANEPPAEAKVGTVAPAKAGTATPAKAAAAKAAAPVVATAPAASVAAPAGVAKPANAAKAATAKVAAPAATATAPASTAAKPARTATPATPATPAATARGTVTATCKVDPKTGANGFDPCVRNSLTAKPGATYP